MFKTIRLVTVCSLLLGSLSLLSCTPEVDPPATSGPAYTGNEQKPGKQINPGIPDTLADGEEPSGDTPAGTDAAPATDAATDSGGGGGGTKATNEACTSDSECKSNKCFVDKCL